MKITVNTEGSVTFDITDQDDDNRILKLLSWWQWELTRRKDNKTTTRLPRRPPPVGTLDFESRPGGILTGTRDLNHVYYETWSYLVDKDCPTGIHIDAVIRDLQITRDAASGRLGKLVKLGYVYRTSKGFYRAADGSQKMQLTVLNQSSVKA